MEAKGIAPDRCRAVELLVVDVKIQRAHRFVALVLHGDASAFRERHREEAVHGGTVVENEPTTGHHVERLRPVVGDARVSHTEEVSDR